MKILIKCTRDSLSKARHCGLQSKSYGEYLTIDNKMLKANVAENCWIAVACQEIFPYCSVYNSLSAIDCYASSNNYWRINNYWRTESFNDPVFWELRLPDFVGANIEAFDDCTSSEERMELQPFEFTVDIEPKVLNTILECNGVNLDAFIEVIVNSDHLELVEA